MRLEQLASLVEVSKHKSLNRASDTLQMTQQALSSSMKTMENELGVQLLKRSRKGCVLTCEGEKLLAFAKETLPRYQRLCNEFRETSNQHACQELHGALQIYVNSVFAHSLLSEAGKHFQALHPKVHVELFDKPSAFMGTQLMERVPEGTHRIGFITTPCEEDGTPCEACLPSPELRFHPMTRGGYYACVGKTSMLAHKRSLSIKTLLKYPLVIGASDETHDTTLHRLLSRYGTPHVVLSVKSLALWHQAITRNVGVGFLHDVFLDDATTISNYASEAVLIRVRETMPALAGCLIPGELEPIHIELLHCLPTGQGRPLWANDARKC